MQTLAIGNLSRSKVGFDDNKTVEVGTAAAEVNTVAAKTQLAVVMPNWSLFVAVQ